MSAGRLALFAVTAWLALAPAARTQVVYSVMELPGVGQYAYSSVQAINNAGQTAGLGTSTFTGIPGSTVIRTTPGVGSQDLGTALGVQVSAFGGLNAAGQVAANLIVSGTVHAARYTNGAGWLDLGTLPGHFVSGAAGINNVGQVVGTSSASVSQIPFRYTDGAGMQALPLPPGAATGSAMAINNLGQVLVGSNISGVGRSFRYTDGVGYQDLGTLPGGTATQANAINDAGQVVGFSRNAAGVARPFLYTDLLGIQDLGTLPGGTGGTAEAINAIGILTGSANVSGGAAHAFIYDSMMRDLNNLIAPTSGWVLTDARGINDSGVIVGIGTLNGRQASFQLTPVPEPSSLALMAVASGFLVIRLRRRRQQCPAAKAG